jgi:hypothetical protein
MRMAMIAITTSSSISVKAMRRDLGDLSMETPRRGQRTEGRNKLPGNF